MTTATIDTGITTSSTKSQGLVRTGVKAGVAAAAATTAVAAVAHAAGVNFESAPGEAIPLLGFAQLTLVFTAVGVLIARVAKRRSTFVKTTVILTAWSLVPDVVMSFDTPSKLTLMLTHVVAAAIVIPALASRLRDR